MSPMNGHSKKESARSEKLENHERCASDSARSEDHGDMGRPSFSEDYESRRIMLRLMSDAELELTALTLGLSRGIIGNRRSGQRFGITASEAYAERIRRRYSCLTNGPASQRRCSDLSEEIDDANQ